MVFLKVSCKFEVQVVEMSMDNWILYCWIFYNWIKLFCNQIF